MKSRILIREDSLMIPEIIVTSPNTEYEIKTRSILGPFNNSKGITNRDNNAGRIVKFVKTDRIKPKK